MRNQSLLALVLAVATATASPLTLASSDPAQDERRIEVGFSPEGTAQALILTTLKSARSSIRLSAYVFTNPQVTSALIAAKERGVDVAVVAGHRSNF